MRRSAQFALQKNEVENALQFVRDCLAEFTPKRNATKITTVLGEIIGSMVSHKSEEGILRVSVQKAFGRTWVEVNAPGHEYPLLDSIQAGAIDSETDIGREALEDLKLATLRSFAGDIKYRHRDGYNYIRMILYRYRRAFLYKTLFALFAGIAFAALLSAFAPESFNLALNEYVLSPVKTIYLNVLRMIVAPVVFFSIVTCVGGFSSLRELGKIGGKTLFWYALTTVIAVGVGIGIFFLLQPGRVQIAAPPDITASIASSEISLRDLLIDMFPSNIISPFLNDNMPQLIFLALICGIAAGLIGQYSIVLKSLFDAFNELFMKIAGIIIRFMPIAIFFSIASTILMTGARTMLSVLGMFGTFVFGLAVMGIVYIILLIAVGRLNPVTFFRKYAPTMVQVFSMSSSNAAIPINMEVAQKKLGVSSKVSSLTIPLGSTINMHGTCIVLAVFSLALARVYGMPVSSGSLITLAVTIVILSMGAPGIPGGVVICLSVLLEQLCVPAEGISLIMGIGPVIGMFLCMSNCLGDMVVTTLVAKSSKELDLEIYNQKEPGENDEKG